MVIFFEKNVKNAKGFLLTQICSCVMVIPQYGRVLVSTGRLKTVKLFVDCDHVKTQTLNLNADNRLAAA